MMARVDLDPFVIESRPKSERESLERDAAKYVSDYDPLIEALGGVGAAIPAPDFHHSPTFAPDDPMARVARQAAASGTTQDSPGPSFSQLASPRAPSGATASASAPVDYMGQSRAAADEIGQRHRLANLVSTFLSAGENQGKLADQSRFLQGREMQAGAQRQARSDAMARQQRADEASRAKSAAQSELSDPNSPRNRQYQANLLRTFPSLDPATVRTMTIAGHKHQRDLIDPAKRARLAEATESAKESSAEKYEDSRLKRALRAAKEKQKALLPGDLKKARASATVIGSRRLEAEERAEQRLLARESRAESRRASQDVERQAKEYGQALIKAGIPDQKFRVNKAIQAAESAKRKRGEIFSSSDFAHWKIGSIGLMSLEGKKVAEEFQGLMNITLKDRSGTAVSAQEFENLKKELGSGLFSSEEDLERALFRMKELIEENEVRETASFSEDAIDLYRQRETGARREKSAKKQSKSRSDRVVVRYKGRMLRIPRSRLKDAVADGAEEVPGG